MEMFFISKDLYEEDPPVAMDSSHKELVIQSFWC